jgi:two-component system OmpR family sensor kinase
MRNRWRNLSLALRLTAVYVGLVAVLLVADGAILFAETRAFLVDSTMIRQRDIASPQIIDWSELYVVTGNHDADFVRHASILTDDLSSPDTTAVVFDPGGTAISEGRATDDAVPPPLDPGPFATALGGEAVSYLPQGSGSREIVTLLPIRVEAGPDAGRVIGVVQLSSPTAAIEAILGRELIGIVVVVAITLGLVWLGGYLLTTRSLNPLRRVIETCRQIAAGDFSQRVVLTTREDEVGQVGTAFNQMASRIEASFEVQRRFISDAAHELRTPLTALRGAMEVLMRGSGDDPATARQLMRAMYHDIVRLSDLAEQMLDTARLETAIPLHRQEVSLQDFLDEQARNARLLDRDHVIVTAGDATATLSIDVNLLGQALLNLLDNAARHSPPGSTIILGRRVLDGRAEIWVTDHGEGIAPDDLPHVFDSFFRSDRSRSRRRGGAGLGLALVEAIVAAHGGNVRAESTLGIGSTFTISVPTVTAAPAATAAAPHAAASSAWRAS